MGLAAGVGNTWLDGSRTRVRTGNERMGWAAGLLNTWRSCK
jgi:hypothetical protein